MGALKRLVREGGCHDFLQRQIRAPADDAGKTLVEGVAENQHALAETQGVQADTAADGGGELALFHQVIGVGFLADITQVGYFLQPGVEQAATRMPGLVRVLLGDDEPVVRQQRPQAFQRQHLVNKDAAEAGGAEFGLKVQREIDEFPGGRRRHELPVVSFESRVSRQRLQAVQKQVQVAPEKRRRNQFDGQVGPDLSVHVVVLLPVISLQPDGFNLRAAGVQRTDVLDVARDERLAGRGRGVEHPGLDVQRLRDQVEQVVGVVRDDFKENMPDVVGLQQVNEKVDIDMEGVHHVNRVVAAVEHRAPAIHVQEGVGVLPDFRVDFEKFAPVAVVDFQPVFPEQQRAVKVLPRQGCHLVLFSADPHLDIDVVVKVMTKVAGVVLGEIVQEDVLLGHFQSGGAVRAGGFPSRGEVCGEGHREGRAIIVFFCRSFVLLFQSRATEWSATAQNRRVARTSVQYATAPPVRSPGTGRGGRGGRIRPDR